MPLSSILKSGLFGAAASSPPSLMGMWRGLARGLKAGWEEGFREYFEDLPGMEGEEGAEGVPVDLKVVRWGGAGL